MERAGKPMFTLTSAYARHHPTLHLPTTNRAILAAHRLTSALIERFESLHKFPSHFV